MAERSTLMPLARSRNWSPDWVPAGIVTLARPPSMVGTSIAPPRLAVVMRSGTPQDVVSRIYAILQAGVKDSDFAKTLDTLNLDPVLLEPAQAKTFLQQETQRYGALVEKSGLEKQ